MKTKQTDTRVYLRKDKNRKNLFWDTKFHSELWLLEFQDKYLGYRLTSFHTALLMTHD